MGYDLDKLYEGPRSERRAKRRKVNRVLNILIGLVVVLILFFGGKLIFGDNKEDVTANTDANQETKAQDTNKGSKNESKDNSTTKDEEKADSDSNDKEDKDVEQKDDEENTAKEPESTEDATVTEGDPESNVSKTIQNPAWEPIGTEQSEPHTIVYDEGSTDRIEIEKAVSYATGLDKADMIVWWLGRNGENSISATISSKETQQIYKVYLDWVTEKGWKPVKVEELKENDSPTYKKNNEEAEEEDSE